MVYFDGAEDVHEPFWHHVAAHNTECIACSTLTTGLRIRALHALQLAHDQPEQCLRHGRTARRHEGLLRLMPCPTAAARALDFSRIQFGWLGRFGSGPLGYPGPDVFEYIAAGRRPGICPISLHVSLKNSHRTPGWMTAWRR